jgi:ubiquitin C-terminal hydrolase
MTLSLAYESNLEKCITNFLKEDTLDKHDQYKCEKCNQNSKAKIKTELSKLPNILVFHLKRFEFPSMQKIKGKCKYAPIIEMSK